MSVTLEQVFLIRDDSTEPDCVLIVESHLDSEDYICIRYPSSNQDDGISINIERCEKLIEALKFFVSKHKGL